MTQESNSEALNRKFSELLNHVDQALEHLREMEVDSRRDPELHKWAQDSYENLLRIRQQIPGHFLKSQ